MAMSGCEIEPLNEETFAKFRRLVYETTNINMREGKEILIANRLRKRLIALGLKSYGAYYRYLTDDETGPGELQNFIDAVSTNVTYFYRETNHLTLMRETVFPDLFARRRHAVLWSAGCASGEEPYTLRMVFEEGLGRKWEGSLDIIATDINGEVIEAARRGLYDSRSVRFVPPTVLSRYFHREGAEQYRVAEGLRSSIEFRVHNLLKDPPPAERVDVIFCRNVMIYFDKATQRRLADELFASVVDRDGYLCIGHSESLAGTSERFHFMRGIGAPVYRLNGDGNLS